MRFSTVSAALMLPLLAIADTSFTSSTTTLTSTQLLTKTITVSQVVGYVTSTYARNSTTMAAGPTAVGTASTTTTLASGASSTAASASTSIPANYMGAASSLNSMHAGSAAVILMVAAMLL